MSRHLSESCQDPVLCGRIVGEFLEMPGLSLTLPQACRLWAIDCRRCADALDALQRAGFLTRSGDRYLLAGRERRVA